MGEILVVNATHFINVKADQLSYYADALLMGQIPDGEVDLYCWDTLEEWSQVRASDASITPLERVFWYLLHQITFWNSSEIKECPKLKSEVDSCIDFIRGDGHYPAFCAGVRP